MKLRWAGFAAALAPLALTLAWSTSFEWSDGGLMLDSGARVLAGQAPYRDFAWHYLPGAPYLVAAVEAVFGPRYVAVRAVFVVAVMATFLLVAWLARRIAPGAAWIVAPLVLLPYATAGARPILNHAILEPLAGMCTIALLLGGEGEPTWRRRVAAGVPAGLLLLFNHLSAVALVAGAWAALALCHAWAEDGKARPSVRTLAADALAVAAPTAVAFAIVLGVGVIRGGNAEMFDWAFARLFHRYLGTNASSQLWDPSTQLGSAGLGVIGGHVARLVRTVRLGAFAVGIRALPFAALAVCAWTLRPSARSCLTPRARRAIIVTVSVGAALFVETFKGYKQDSANLASLELALAGWLAVALGFGERPRRVTLAAGALFAALCATFLAGTALQIARDRRTMPLVATQLGRLRSPSTDEAQARVALLAALARHANARTLLSYYYEPSIYPLSGLGHVSYYDYFTLTLTDERDFARVCDELRAHPPDLVLRDPDWDARGLPPATFDNALERCVSDAYVEAERVPSPLPGHSYRLMVHR